MLSWFARRKRDLPWRRSKDSYRIWLSEIMLQQTRVAAVIPYYERFLENFPDVHALAGAPTDHVLKNWAGLGYYSRAKNLQSAAKEIVALHSGEFPREVRRRSRPAGNRSLHRGRCPEHCVRFAICGAGRQRRARLGKNFCVNGDLRVPATWRKLESTAQDLLARKSARRLEPSHDGIGRHRMHSANRRAATNARRKNGAAHKNSASKNRCRRREKNARPLT